MRNAIFALAFLFSPSLFALNFFGDNAAHQFSGPGQWKALCGQTGNYDTLISVQDNELTGKITMDGQTFTYKVAAVADKNGVYQVTGGAEQSAVIGYGYCFGKRCHYQANFQGTNVEETFELVGKALLVHGSKSSSTKPQGDCPSDFAAWSAELTAR